jgi:hypothetical protein
MTENETRADFTATAERWRRRCTEGPRDLETEPIAVLLLYAFTGETSGDIVGDVLAAILDTIAGWRVVGEHGGGGVTMLDLGDVRSVERRVRVALELRRREHLCAGGAP